MKNTNCTKFFVGFKKIKGTVFTILGTKESNNFLFEVENKTRAVVENEFFMSKHYLTVWLAVQQVKSDYTFMDGKVVLDLLFLNKDKLQHETDMVLLHLMKKLRQEKNRTIMLMYKRHVLLQKRINISRVSQRSRLRIPRV